MAAAMSVDSFVGPTAPVKSRHVPRERLRVAPGGSFGDRQAEAERAREAGMLTETERGELVVAWSGHEGAAGCRSNLGAVIELLMRAPPREGRGIEDAIERELLKVGRQGVAREKLVDVLALENPKTQWSGATRYEVRQVLRGMRGRAQAAAEGERDPGPAVEYFVTEAERSNPETGEPEVVAVEMVRLVQRAARQIPPAVPREDRWRRADEELEAEWRAVGCHESAPGGGGRLPPHQAGGRADGALRALRRVPAEHRRVLERAYGAGAPPRYADVWEDEVARLAPLTPSCEAARRRLVAAQSTPATRATVDRSTFAADALRAVLDSQPEEGPARQRWGAEREAFVAQVEREARRMLADAVRAYREVRTGD